MTLKLKHKIVALAIISALLPAMVMGVLTFIQKKNVQDIISKELKDLIRENLSYVANGVYETCETSNNILSQEVLYDLNVARHILGQHGQVELSPTDKVSWKAVNQFTHEATEVELPKMLVGGKWLGNNKTFSQSSLIVDEVKKLVGGTCTIFQRMNEQGDLLRVDTNVKKLDGTRAIGTYIPAVDMDGKPNKVTAAVMSGKTYKGRAFVVNAWYLTAYEPIKDNKGKIIGCLYFGLELNAMEAIKEVIQKIKIGKSGYVGVLAGSGKDKGNYIISKDRLRDGKNILNSKNPLTGKFFIKDFIEDSMRLGRGKVGFSEYPWKNPSDLKPRMKTGAYVYFEPWDWVIIATLYADDYSEAKEKVGNCIDSLLWSAVIGGFVIILISIIFALYLGGKIGDPISRITEIAHMIADGDLHAAIQRFKELYKNVSSEDKLDEQVFARDETGQLTRSIATMAKNLNSLVGQVQRSTIQLVSTATEIAASSKEQEATVNEFGASTNEIVSSSKQISATSVHLVETMKEVTEVSNHTAELADVGHSSLSEMGTTMEHLEKSTDSISSKLSIINEKANNINNVVSTITKVADQTNLLSLNAAIEAEKAGEYGKGFSVVAREIRRLADQTAVATLDIIKMVKEMQSAVSSGVMEMDKFAEEVRRGVLGACQISSQLERIIQQVQCLPPKFDLVTDGMMQQAEGAQQISESMVQLNEGAQQTAESLREFNEATSQLNSATQTLQKEVSIFKVS